jgi:hypothetical protein
VLQWSSWRKLVLIFVVCIAHIGLLVGFNYSFTSGKSNRITAPSSKDIAINLRPSFSNPFAETLTKPQEQVREESSNQEKPQSTLATQKSVVTETPYRLGFQNRDYFLDADAVDKTADPGDSFETRLAQLLPLQIQTIVLEFWIEKDGHTLEVRCIEGACSDDVIASLSKLAELEFVPAVKNSEAVASRKVIQIDPRPSFNF